MVAHWLPRPGRHTLLWDLPIGGMRTLLLTCSVLTVAGALAWLVSEARATGIRWRGPAVVLTLAAAGAGLGAPLATNASNGAAVRLTTEGEIQIVALVSVAACALAGLWRMAPATAAPPASALRIGGILGAAAAIGGIVVMVASSLAWLPSFGTPIAALAEETRIAGHLIPLGVGVMVAGVLTGLGGQAGVAALTRTAAAAIVGIGMASVTFALATGLILAQISGSWQGPTVAMIGGAFAAMIGAIALGVISGRIPVAPTAPARPLPPPRSSPLPPPPPLPPHRAP